MTAHRRTWWWRLSCALNAALGGRRCEPLCSRVWRSAPTPARTAFIVAMGAAFREPGHCEAVHRAFIIEENPPC